MTETDLATAAERSSEGETVAAQSLTETPREDHATYIRVQPSKGWVSLNLRQLLDYRQLVYFLIWRDIKVRYRQTIMGASWAIIQPLTAMLIFSLFFGRLAGVPSDGIPYPIFSYAALVPWIFFANGVTNGSNSLVISAEILRKIYFPRLTMPSATVLSGLLDFTLAFLVLIGMVFFYRVTITSNIIWLPGFLLLALITSLGMTFWLSALNVQFRDVRYAVPFLVQAWLFATPVAYPSSLLSEPWRTLYGLNPMAGVVEGFRWSLFDTDPAPGPMIILSAIVAVALLISGAFYFRKTETTFADYV